MCVCLYILTFQSFRNAIRVSNSLDLDQTRCLSGMIWLQLSADGKINVYRSSKEMPTRYTPNLFGGTYIFFFIGEAL